MGDFDDFEVLGADRERGAFFPITLLYDDRPFALDVLTLNGDGRLKEVTSFITRSTLSRDRHYYERYPEQPLEDPSKILAAFDRFGMPDRLD